MTLPPPWMRRFLLSDKVLDDLLPLVSFVLLIWTVILMKLQLLSPELGVLMIMVSIFTGGFIRF